MSHETSERLSGVYCTVVAQNYLPQALALYSSVREVEPDRELVVLVVDADRTDLATGRDRLTIATTGILGLSDREIHDLAAIYDVVEFSTAVKPLFFKALLDEYQQVTYLDPDTFVVSPLTELESLVEEHGVVLTPHFLESIPRDITHITEVHSLTVGVHNLGFGSFGQKGLPFLDWWWSHLERECLIYPLLGIFVDQKWTDIGATLFDAHSLRHYGYNVGPWNLHERSFTDHNGTLTVDASGDELRLVHFSGFNPRDPDAISVRLSLDMREAGVAFPALKELSRLYAERVLEAQGVLGSPPDYAFATDADGGRISKRSRRTYRKALLAGEVPPSPFVASEVDAYRRWNLSAWRSRIGVTMGDAAMAAKYVFPDEFTAIKKSLPKQFSWVRERLLTAARVRR